MPILLVLMAAIVLILLGEEVIILLPVEETTTLLLLVEELTTLLLLVEELLSEVGLDVAVRLEAWSWCDVDLSVSPFSRAC
jgi:hypothetical protein